MFFWATCVFLLATLALSTPAPTSHDRYVDEVLQHLQAAYGKKQAVQDTSYDGTATGEHREIQQPREDSGQPQANDQNKRQTGSRHGNVISNMDHMLNRANHYGVPLRAHHNAELLSRHHRHAPQLGQLRQLDKTIEPKAEEADESDSDHLSSKRQVDHSLGHILNKANNYGVSFNSRQHRNVPQFGELQESGESKAAGANVDGKMGHVLNEENHYGMPSVESTGETQPAALTARDGMGERDNRVADSIQYGTKDAGTSTESRMTFWKLLPDKIYKNREHRSI